MTTQKKKPAAKKSTSQKSAKAPAAKRIVISTTPEVELPAPPAPVAPKKKSFLCRIFGL